MINKGKPERAGQAPTHERQREKKATNLQRGSRPGGKTFECGGGAKSFLVNTQNMQTKTQR